MSDSTAGAAGLLLGRRTYEIFTATWPYADDTDPAVAAMNTMPKYVASRTLTHLEWANSTLLGADVAAEVIGIKDRADGEFLVLGSGEFLRTLIEHDLVDEYRLLVFPLLLGDGKKLFDDGTTRRPLALVDTTASTSGVLINTYRRADG
ncbi:dihydrofolate reductase family protein [Embleya sp. NPDC050154]|uniref:dihydrofolate reductase family protein n=1 Tax=Embleya sp. NPDC050154 TaxID=3363988 RepID=UPI0037B68EA7